MESFGSFAYLLILLSNFVLPFSIPSYVPPITFNLFNIHLWFNFLLSPTPERCFCCLGCLMTLPHGRLFPHVFANGDYELIFNGASSVGILFSLVEGSSLKHSEGICNSFLWVPARHHYPDPMLTLSFWFRILEPWGNMNYNLQQKQGVFLRSQIFKGDHQKSSGDRHTFV